jgi:hypothetical protein
MLQRRPVRGRGHGERGTDRGKGGQVFLIGYHTCAIGDLIIIPL